MKHTQRRSLGLLLPLLAACVADSRWPRIETQQWPAPMQVVPGALDTSALHGIISSEPGSEEVFVLRHGDPVQVRPAGGAAPYPLAFHDKEVKLNSGSWVLCSPGGKVEILWNGGTSVTLSGRTTGLVGSKSRGEPTFAFVELENTLLNLRRGDQVRLLGGALLSAEVGPIAVERLDSGVLRVENQSKGEAQLWFREAYFLLDPGQEIHLPLLSAGGAPLGSLTDRRRYGREEMLVELDGAAELLPHPEGVRVIMNGAHEIRGMGLRMQLAQGEQLVIRGVEMNDGVAPTPTPIPTPIPAPEPVPVPKPDLDPELESESKPIPQPASDHGSEGNWVPAGAPVGGGGSTDGARQE